MSDSHHRIPTYLQTIDAEVLKAGKKADHTDLCYLLLASYSHRWQPSAAAAAGAVGGDDEIEGGGGGGKEMWLGQLFTKTREALSDTTWQKSIVSSR